MSPLASLPSWPVTIGLLIAAYIAYKVILYATDLFRDYFLSSLRVLPTSWRNLCDPVFSFLKSTNGTAFLALHDFHEQMGSILRYKSGGVSLADPALVRRVLKTEDLDKADFYDLTVPPSMKASVFNTRDRGFHRSRRKLHSLSFSLKYLAGLEPFMVKVWDAFQTKVCEELDSSPDGTAPLDLCHAFSAVTNDVIGATAFGQSFNSISLPDQHPFVRHTALILDAIIWYIILPFSYKHWEWFPFAESINFVRTFVTRVVRERKDLIKKKGIDAAPQDILQNMVMAEDAETGTRLNEEDVLAETTTLLIAGSDTTANTLAWTLYLLARHPNYTRRLREELSEVPEDADGHLPHSYLKNLPLLNGIISEAMRLYPVAGTSLLRKVGPTQTFTIPVPGTKNELVLEPGTEIIVPIYNLHRSKRIWTRANEFWPERWTMDDGKAEDGPAPLRRDAFFPFSEGSRDCIGKNFAWQELRIILAHFVTVFDLELANNEEIEPRDRFILSPKDGKINVTVRRRRT